MTFISSICLTVALSLVTNVGHAAPASSVSHEDIRDAILSLVTIFRDNSDKLERHEFRERQLGEQLKKALAGLDKRYKSQDQNIEKLAALMLRFDEKMKNFDIQMKERDEREKAQQQKSQETIEDVQLSIAKMLKEMQEPVKDSTAIYTIQDSNREFLETLKTEFNNKIDMLSGKVEQLQINMADSKQGAIASTIELDEGIRESIRETERILKKFDKKNEESPEIDSKWQEDLTSALRSQQETLKDLLQVATKTSENLNFLPTKTDFQELSNGTQDGLHEMKEELMAKTDQGVSKIKMKIDESIAGVGNGQEEIVKTITELQSMGENLYSDISKSYGQLLTEIKGLSKVEQVMIQTADNVLDTKRRIEYGVHQILLEVGDLVKAQSKSLNTTVNQRFNDIEETFLENQTGALVNISSKIETEISQVWRQIGIMYQQLTASADTLDKLQQQTDTYVNGSVKTMDSMEGKVSKITNRMSEVDENLNYLLGKLSLVTSEFNQIKSGLASALDNIRHGFLDVHNDIKDSGPGPKPIASEYEIISSLDQNVSS
ncbi:hypothetical protein RUM43_002221 [Polyplax serrata]|uniref:Paramyosin n=1 Tax=Polyplax serrata TaxID=468196 RepID=A0AAN8NT06_POLSC